MNNAELIKALRCKSANGLCGYAECEYKSKYAPICDEYGIRRDAADALEAAEKRIAELEAQLKEGEWEERYIEDANPMFRRRFYCSRCGDWNTYGKTNYCPNCGARMANEQKRNEEILFGGIENV